MWASFKADLKEFASGAAEETTAVVTKVGVNIARDGENAPVSGGVGGGLGVFASSSSGQRGGRAGGGVDGSVLFANAAFSMGEKGLKGLQDVSSMVGGIVAPPAPAPVATNRSAPSYASSGAAVGNSTPSAALSSMMLTGEDDEEEEEFGWDDDDDDLEIEEEDGGGDNSVTPARGGGGTDFLEEHLASTEDSANKLSQPASKDGGIAAPEQSPKKEVLLALQSKLDTVEKARAELQIEHRSQTAELVELRAKVEELEQQRHSGGSKTLAASSEGTSGKSEQEARALEDEIKQLKKQLHEQQSKGDLTKEHEELVESLIQEKEALERELRDQKQQNDQLSRENQTLQEQMGQAARDKGTSKEQQELQRRNQQQIKDLAAELQSLQVKFGSKEQSLREMEESHALALKDAQESKEKLAVLVKEVQRSAEKEAHDASVDARATESAGSNATSPPAVAAEEEPAVAAAASRGKIGDASFETANDDDVARDDQKPVTPVKIDDDDDEELSDDWGDGDW